jgi:hypothetical protein
MPVMLSQEKAEELILQAKLAAKSDVFTWLHNQQQEELLLSAGDRELQFLLTLKRNPFEVKAQLRTRDRHIPLVRMDNALQHVNPDGTVLRGPHLHWYKEGHGVAWAEPIDWYKTEAPMDTIFTFLDLIHARFPNGFQEALI